MMADFTDLINEEKTEKFGVKREEVCGEKNGSPS